MPAGQRHEIERQLKQLPRTYTTEQIVQMYRNLQDDVNLLRTQGCVDVAIEQRLHNKHKTLAFSYPSLFFKVVKGEMSEFMFTKVMEIKQALDCGEITPEEAKDMIVDNAKKHVEGAAPRPSRPKTDAPGATVHEVRIKTRVDENSEMKVCEEDID